MSTDFWSETKMMAKNLLDESILKDKYFQKPSPSFIFQVVMDILKKTGFPKNLFSKKQQDFDYFRRHIEHKKKILEKITELINFIIDKEGGLELDINIQDILKGKNPEITNEFLRNLITFATNGNNYDDIIKQYIIKRNVDKYMYKNLEIPKGESLNEKCYILWIDKNMKDNEKQKLLKDLENNIQYHQAKNFKKICLNNIDNALILLRNIKFRIIYIIISGDLYPDYYHKMKKYKNVLKCIPICIIYTNDELKNCYLKKKRHFLLTNDICESINNSYYNYGGITSDFYACMDFISNFYFCIKAKFFPKKDKIKIYKGNITFEKINSEMQLIVPFLYNELINEENKISDNEIQYFKYIMINRHDDDKFINLISPLLFTKGIPYNLLLKFFIRAYTEKASFFDNMNNALFNNKEKEYLTFVNLLFGALSNKILSISEEECLYRACYMGKKDIDELIYQYKAWKENNDKSLPSFLVYSKCLMSFTKDKNRVLSFPEPDKDENYKIVFELKCTPKLINKYSSNVDMEDISFFEEEKEVLFLPFNTFILRNIYYEKNDEKKNIIIELEYLGTYEKIQNKYRQDNELKEKINKQFISYFKHQKYIRELINNNVLGTNYTNEDLKEKAVYSKIKTKIKEKFDIQIKSKIGEDNNELNIDKTIIEINEINKVNYKANNPSKFLINEENLISNEIMDEREKKYTNFFIPYFKNEDIENRWTGKYNKSNQKEGKGIEYNLENDIIFEGEYEMDKKIKGIEYYIFKTKDKKFKKFEGNYNEGKRWNGFIYDRKNDNKYKIENGNGLVKEFHENGNLYYDGEIRDGVKDGKGKIFDETGYLIYEGNFLNGIMHGNGKEYNKCGDLIYEGDFKNGKRNIGNIYIYNDHCELIAEKKFVGGIYITKKIKCIKDYKSDLIINDSLLLMEENICHNELEYEIEGEYKYEGNYNNGKKWNGKFKKMDKNNSLFIDGEYKNGKKYWKLYDKLGNLIFEGKNEENNEYQLKKYKNGLLIFEGIYKNGKRYKGKEFNDNGILIFNGIYKNGKRWDGQLKLYDKSFRLLYDGYIKKGKKWNGINSKVDNKLGFEGIYKNGRKWNGNGIEQIGKENMVFEGDFINGVKYNGNFYAFYNSEKKLLVGNLVNGFGNNIKRYNYNGNLIFEGNYDKGEIIYGKEFSNLREIIFEGEYKYGKKYNGIYSIRVNNCIYSYYIQNGKVINVYIETNREVIYIGDYVNGLKGGNGKEYNENGKLIFVGEFREGYRYEGKEFNENGKLIFNGQYSKGIPFNGKKKEYIGNILKFEGEIQNGLKLKGKEYDLNGKLIFEGEYKNGNKFKGKELYTPDLYFEGEYGNEVEGKEYDNKNILRFEGLYKNTHRFKGKEYDEFGELIFEGTYEINEVSKKGNIKLDGKGKEYVILKQPQGEYKKELIFEGEYKKGKKWKGKFKKYNSSGIKIYEGDYVDGLLLFNKRTKLNKKNDKNNNIISKDSDFKLNKDTEEKYYINNKLKYIQKKIDDKRYSYIEYDRNGQTIFEGEYLNNQKYKGKEFNLYGNIIYEGEYKNNERYNGKGYNNCSQFTYVNGKIEGSVITYNYAKHELFEGEYKNGEKLNGKLKTYFDSKNFMLKREITLKNGKSFGKGKEYFKNKKLKYIGEFQDDYYHGEGKLYYEFTGYINYIGEFKKGKKHGKGKEFDIFGNIINEGSFNNGKYLQ